MNSGTPGQEVRLHDYTRNNLVPADRHEMNAIYSLETSGATNAESGLHLGYQLANQAYRLNATNRVILCSDGVANVGLTNPDDLLNTIAGYVQEGIYLTTVGVGMGDEGVEWRGGRSEGCGGDEDVSGVVIWARGGEGVAGGWAGGEEGIVAGGGAASHEREGTVAVE